MEENQPNPSDPRTETPATQLDQPPPEELAQPQSRKKLVLILLILLIVIGLGAWAISVRHKSSTKTTGQAQITSPATQLQTAQPDIIAYAFRAKDSDPYTIYWRPASGGDRTTALTLTGANNSPSYSDVRGQKVVFDANDGIYVSQDAGKTYKNVYRLDPAKESQNQAITSLHFSNDGQKIVFAFLPGISNGQSKNTVKVMDLDGQNATDLFSSDRAGVFVLNYDPTKKIIVYQTGCYFCDGGPGFPHLRDLKTNQDKELFGVNSETNVFNTVAVNPDGQKILYYVGVNDSALASEVAGLGWQGGPPYKIKQLDIGSSQTTDLASVGTLHEKATDGKFRLYTIQLGYTIDNQPFYSADKQLFVYKGSAFSKVLEGNSNIFAVPFVSATKVIVETGEDKNNTFSTLLTNYDVSSQKATTIYQGDNNTRLFGVTTK